jgi:hypothetical protein
MSYEYLYRAEFLNSTLDAGFQPFDYDQNFLAFSQQTDGSIFWSSTFGIVTMASGMLQRRAGNLHLALPPYRPAQPLPPGALPGAYPLEMAGAWEGLARNFYPTGSFDNATPYPIRLNISPPSASRRVWDIVGNVEYPPVDGEGPATVAPLRQMYAVECTGNVAGPDPSYCCFQFLEDHLDQDATGRGVIDSPFEFAPITVSLQQDGSVHWSFHQGVWVPAFAELHKVESSLKNGKGEHAASGISRGANPTATTPVQELCSSELVRACFESFYDAGCEEFPPFVEGFDCASLDLFAIQDSPLLCQDMRRCNQPGGTNASAGNDLAGSYGRFPPAEMKGVATLRMPDAPHDYGLFSLGDGFSMRRRPVSANGIFGCGAFEGLLDTTVPFGVGYCLRGEYESAHALEPGPGERRQRNPGKMRPFLPSETAHLESSTSPLGDDWPALSSLVNFNFPIICYNQLKGPNPTGNCLFALERVLKEGRTVYGYASELFDDPLKNELAFTSFSLQTDGTIYWAAMLGNVVYADGILERAASAPGPEPDSSSSSTMLLSAVEVTLLAIGVGVVVGSAGFWVYKARERKCTEEAHAGDYVLGTGDSDMKGRISTGESPGKVSWFGNSRS